ncbi:MAG: Tad domain-containing protein, partial [Planctomycetaceae bacterium]
MCSQLDRTQPAHTAGAGSERRSPEKATALKVLLRWAQPARGLSARVHSDERGTISILTVFTLLMFTMLLIMIINVATHVDDKLKMQNAADAAAYSGGLVLSRGMNAVAFSNHLLCDVFAITAYLREGRDRNAEQLTPEILDAWERNGELFSRAEYEKFQDLSSAIGTQIAQERDLIATFGEMTQMSSDFALSVFEYVLSGDGDSGNPGTNSNGGLIPAFQRTVIETTPTRAQQATNERAFRDGLTNRQLKNLSS